MIQNFCDMKFDLIFATCLVCAGLASAQAVENDCQPAVVFGSHMVLQRDIPVPVWGTAVPGDRITVEFAARHKEAEADPKGRWKVVLDPMKASAVPRRMIIRSSQGKSEIDFDDVLVGEVWLCSGQSNMEMPVGNLYRPDVYPGVVNFRQETAAATNDQIRLFRVDHQAASMPMRYAPTTGWEVCSPKAAARFSAVGYFFGRDLQSHLKVPIGMICSAWSATYVKAWSCPSGLRTLPKFARDLKELEARRAAAGLTNSLAKVRREDPSALFDGMIAPLIPYAFRGVIWYQGENDVKDPQDYRKLFPALISSWRRYWNLPTPLHVGAPGGDFSFLFVQLAAYGRQQKQPVEHGWAELRAAQAKALQLTNTGMAVTIDIGDATHIHPPNKQEVGRRLSLLARAIAYREPIQASAPIYESMTVDGDKIHLDFADVGGGLIVKGGNVLTGFAIAGADGEWKFARASIAGNQVIVSNPQVSHPVAVRYDWANNPAGNLFSRSGLPAAPFQTDQPLQD